MNDRRSARKEPSASPSSDRRLSCGPGRIAHFTASNGFTSQYRIWDDEIDHRRPVGLLSWFHSDGAEEFHHPEDEWVLGGSHGVIAHAQAMNMIVIAPLTPQEESETIDGVVTWWQWFRQNENPRYAYELITSVLEERNIDRGQMWFCGFSGGAEFVSALLVPHFGAQLGIEGGGLIAFAGGDAPPEYGVKERSLRLPPAQTFTCHWIVGEKDTAAHSIDGFDGVKAAATGVRWYKDHSFVTHLTVINGLHHILDSDVFGGYFRSIAGNWGVERR